MVRQQKKTTHKEQAINGQKYTNSHQTTNPHETHHRFKWIDTLRRV